MFTELNRNEIEIIEGGNFSEFLQVLVNIIVVSGEPIMYL